jgi:hypothetical protein
MKNIFERERNISITEEEFVILVLTYPIFLVANADKNFDIEEKKLMEIILGNFIRSAYRDTLKDEEVSNMIASFIEDFKFISQNESIFKLPMLELLRNYSIEVKNSINSLIKEIAEISEGISESENNMITFLNDYL